MICSFAFQIGHMLGIEMLKLDILLVNAVWAEVDLEVFCWRERHSVDPIGFDEV